jgi:hypothetical protein
MTIKSSATSEQRRVPVVSSTGKPLMPCKPARAYRFINCKKIAYSPYILLGVQNRPIIKNSNRTFRIRRAAEKFIIKNRGLCNLSQGANYVSH